MNTCKVVKEGTRRVFIVNLLRMYTRHWHSAAAISYEMQACVKVMHRYVSADENQLRGARVAWQLVLVWHMLQ